MVRKWLETCQSIGLMGLQSECTGQPHRAHTKFSSQFWASLILNEFELVFSFVCFPFQNCIFNGDHWMAKVMALGYTDQRLSAYLLKSKNERKTFDWTNVWCDYADWFRQNTYYDLFNPFLRSSNLSLVNLVRFCGAIFMCIFVNGFLYLNYSDFNANISI